MPIIGSEGAASSQGFGQFARTAVANYIEDVFSTWLYTGTGTSITVNNGIDFAGKGGLLWAKDRSFAGENNRLYDTARGYNRVLFSNTTDASGTVGDLTSFNSNGFTVASAATSNINYAPDNPSPHNYVTWSFRKQPKFFDVVTYTGSGVGQNVAHNLGSVPGFIVYKRTNGAANWCALARKSNGTYETLYLNTTSATLFTAANAAAAGLTATTFDPSTIFGGEADDPGNTYVAYLFAHNAGGFGLTGTDNVISCGSYVGNGSTDGPVVTLGYEPQWVLIKAASASGWWELYDSMRGLTVAGQNDARLVASNDGSEINGSFFTPLATGFQPTSTGADRNTSGVTYIYIAIRRGPMRTPTSGTSVYNAIARTGTSANATVSAGLPGPSDTTFIKQRNGTSYGFIWADRLRNTLYLQSSATDAENSSPAVFQSNPWDVMDGVKVGSGTPSQSQTNYDVRTYINYFLRRAPGFFDEVCYTGSLASGAAIPHNLNVVPELVISKQRSSGIARPWDVSATVLGRGRLLLNSSAAVTSNYWAASPAATSTNIYTDTNVNAPGTGDAWVAYLFASCPGVSKVGSYTGTGATQVINCGFTGGARFVLIKATSTTGDWYVWDSARGIVAGNDPYLALNSTAAEVTITDWVDTAASGFELSNAAGNLANTNLATYIFLAIA